MRATSLALAIVLAARLAGATAADVGPKDRPAYLKAVKLQNAGDWAAALTAFEALPPAARESALARIHMAECKRRLGRWREAAGDLERLVNDTGLDAASRDVAASDLKELRTNIPRLVVSTTAKDLTIHVGHEVVVAPATVELDPGEHAVEARRGEKVVFARTVTASVGKTTELVIDVDAPAPPVPAAIRAPSSSNAVGPPEDRSHSPWAYVAMGAGAAFIGVAAFSYSRALAADDGLRESCLRFCDEDLRADRARWNAVTVTGGIIGAAGLAAGIAMIVFRSDTARTALVVAPRDQGAFARLSVSF